MGKKKLILLAAAVVMLAGLALTASASDFFGLKSILVDDEIHPVAEKEYVYENAEGVRNISSGIMQEHFRKETLTETL